MYTNHVHNHVHKCNVIGLLKQQSETQSERLGFQLFDDTSIKLQTTELCIQVLKSFSATLEHLAMTGNVERQTKE